MTLTQLGPVYEELLDFLVKVATPQQLLAFHISDSAQQRADELTEKNKTDNLTAQERAELEQMLEFDLLVTALKAKAVRALKQQ